VNSRTQTKCASCNSTVTAAHLLSEVSFAHNTYQQSELHVDRTETQTISDNDENAKLYIVECLMCEVCIEITAYAHLQNASQRQQ
jgi:hypothetical protein